MKKIVFIFILIFIAAQCVCVYAADPAFYVKLYNIEKCNIEYVSNTEDDSITFYYDFKKEVAKSGQFSQVNGTPVISNIQISIFDAPVEITGNTEMFNSAVYKNRIAGAITSMPEDPERINSSVVLDTFSDASGGDMCLEEGKTYYAYFMISDARWSWAWTVKPYVFVYGESTSDKPVITPAPTHKPIYTIKPVPLKQDGDGLHPVIIILISAAASAAVSSVIAVLLLKKKKGASK